MAGKLCTGKPFNNIGAGHLRTSKSFCEGLAYRASGTLISRPVEDNPHAGDGDSEANSAWVSGWDVADAASPGAIDPDNAPCCAVSAALVAA